MGRKAIFKVSLTAFLLSAGGLITWYVDDPWVAKSKLTEIGVAVGVLPKPAPIPHFNRNPEREAKEKEITERNWKTYGYHSMEAAKHGYNELRALDGLPPITDWPDFEAVTRENQHVVDIFNGIKNKYGTSRDASERLVEEINHIKDKYPARAWMDQNDPTKVFYEVEVEPRVTGIILMK